MAKVTDIAVATKFINKRDNALSRGIEFTLTLQSIRNMLQADRCYYTGIKLTDKRTGQPMRATDRTIDRIDSTKGYIPGNVVACSHAANSLKAMCEGGGIKGYELGRKVLTKTISRIKKSQEV